MISALKGFLQMISASRKGECIAGYTTGETRLEASQSAFV